MEGRSSVVNVLLSQITRMADRIRKNEMVATLNPGQHLTVLDVMFYRKQVSMQAKWWPPYQGHQG